MSTFGHPAGAPDFTWVPVPLLLNKQVRLVPQPMLLPHLYFESLFKHKKDLWEQTVEGRDPAGPLDFWQNMKDTAFVKNHPHLSRAHWSQTIPVGLHGDGGGFYKHESLFVFAWNSLLGTGTTASKRFVLTVIRKNQMAPGTLDALFKVFAWSFNALLSGISPEQNWEGVSMSGGGQWLANKWRGALVQVRGDWEFHCQIFQLPKWSHAGNMCWMCNAHSEGPLKYTACGADAAWRATRRTHESYLMELAAAERPVPVLLDRVKGLRLDCIMIDMLHTVDQGFASHVIGNILWECVCMHAWGPTTQEGNVERLMDEMKQWYKESKTGKTKIQGKLSIERLKTSKQWPKLKAKAAATRHLARFALQLAEKHLPQLQIMLAQMLCRFYKIVDAEAMFMSAEAKAELPGLGRRLCEVYSILSAQAVDRGVRAYKMSPKVHLFLHVCEWQAVESGNPRFYWVYADEDLVGQMIEVGRSCHPATVNITALIKWLLLAFD